MIEKKIISSFLQIRDLNLTQLHLKLMPLLSGYLEFIFILTLKKVSLWKILGIYTYKNILL